MLRNYIKFMVTAGKDHLLDEINFHYKYLGPHISDGLQRMIHNDESPKIIINDYLFLNLI